MYKEVLWPAVLQKEKLYPEPQANLGRKQTAFSLEGPIQHTHWSQKGGLCPPLSPVPPISFPCARGVGLPWSPRGNGWHEMICSSQRKGSSLTSRLFHTEQKVNVEVKPRGRMFGRLGTAESGMEGLDIVLSEQYETNSVQVLEWCVAREDPLLPEGKERGKNLQHSGCSFVEMEHGRVLHLAFVFCMSIIWTVC